MLLFPVLEQGEPQTHLQPHIRATHHKYGFLTGTYKVVCITRGASTERWIEDTSVWGRGKKNTAFALLSTPYLSFSERSDRDEEDPSLDPQPLSQILQPRGRLRREPCVGRVAVGSEGVRRSSGPCTPLLSLRSRCGAALGALPQRWPRPDRGEAGPAAPTNEKLRSGSD